jgi:hypothetical protein
LYTGCAVDVLPRSRVPSTPEKDAVRTTCLRNIQVLAVRECRIGRELVLQDELLVRKERQIKRRVKAAMFTITGRNYRLKDRAASSDSKQEKAPKDKDENDSARKKSKPD